MPLAPPPQTCRATPRQALQQARRSTRCHRLHRAVSPLKRPRAMPLSSSRRLMLRRPRQMYVGCCPRTNWRNGFPPGRHRPSRCRRSRACCRASKVLRSSSVNGWAGLAPALMALQTSRPRPIRPIRPARTLAVAGRADRWGCGDAACVIAGAQTLGHRERPDTASLPQRRGNPCLGAAAVLDCFVPRNGEVGV